MNTIGENTEKYVPTIIQYEKHTYVGFITEEESNSEVIMPEVYRKFMGVSKGGYPMKEREKAVINDFVYKISLGLYFYAACGLRENGKRYNLNKIKHELNNRK
jgi:hypothetical protein